MNTRIKKLLNKLNQSNIDAIIIYDRNNIRYLSGFSGSSAYLYISNNKSIMLTDFRYIEQASKQCPDFEIIDHGELGVLKTIKKFAIDDNVSKIGFESEIITFNQYKEIKEIFQKFQLIETKSLVEEIRMIKDDEELSYIKKAAEIADNAFTHILSFIKVGITEIDIALELEYFMKRNGASSLAFSTIVASGKNSSLCHAEPSLKKIEQGDFLTMDFGCMFNGYCSDMTRTIVIGKADNKQKEIYNTVLKAQLEALSIVKEGLTGKEVDKIARDIIHEAGFKGYFGHGLGHSVGLFIHEDPRLSPKGFTILKENMVVTIEPGIYVPDFGGVRIEDLICVKENGYVNFTHSNKELIEI